MRGPSGGEFKVGAKGYAGFSDKERIVMNGATLSGEDFSGRRLTQFSSAGSRFESCRFDRARIESGSFGAGRAMSEYVGCVFDGARINMGSGGYTRFEGCSFRDVDLRDWFCFAVEIVDCVFSGRLRKAFFNGAVPADKAATIGRTINDFTGNDFSAMDLVDVSFRTGIDLTRQRLPADPEYLYVAEAATAVRATRAQVITWDDLELRGQALTVLSMLEDDVAAGQRQLLLRAADYPRNMGGAVNALFATLREG